VLAHQLMQLCLLVWLLLAVLLAAATCGWAASASQSHSWVLLQVPSLLQLLVLALVLLQVLPLCGRGSSCSPYSAA
jgi:hypothetical protein